MNRDVANTEIGKLRKPLRRAKRAGFLVKLFTLTTALLFLTCIWCAFIGEEAWVLVILFFAGCGQWFLRTVAKASRSVCEEEMVRITTRTFTNLLDDFYGED